MTGAQSSERVTLAEYDAWVRSRHCDPSHIPEDKRWGDRIHLHDHVHTGWEAWKASRAALSTPASTGEGEVPHGWILQAIVSKKDASNLAHSACSGLRWNVTENEARGDFLRFVQENKPGMSIDDLQCLPVVVPLTALPPSSATGWEAGAEASDAFLRTLIDLTWGEALEDTSLPRSKTQDALIKRAKDAFREERS